MQLNLAKKVVELAESPQNFKLLYKDDISLFDKIKTIAKEIYDANEVIADSKIRDQLKLFEKNGYGIFLYVLLKLNIVFLLIQI